MTTYNFTAETMKNEIELLNLEFNWNCKMFQYKFQREYRNMIDYIFILFCLLRQAEAWIMLSESSIK